MHVQFDTSSISEALRTDERTHELVVAARRGRWKISVSVPVFLEMFATSSAERQVERCQQLMKLIELAGYNFFLGNAPDAAWHVELDQVLMQPLAVPSKWQRGLLGGVQHVAKTGQSGEVGFDVMGNWVREWKTRLRAYWASLRVELQAEFESDGRSVSKLGKGLDTYGPQDVPEQLYRHMLERWIGRPAFPLRRLYKDRERFLCIRAWAALAHLGLYSEWLPPRLRNQHSNTEWMRSDENNWYDAAVASAAAYADRFVTEDRNLTQRCRWLRRHGCLRMRTLSLEELFAQP
jgi:hypothetical protein